MKRVWCLLALALVAVAAQAEPATFKQSAMKGWRLSLETWTFNKATLLETIDKAKDLGIEYLEVFPGQKIGGEATGGFGPGMNAKATELVKAKLAETGVKIVWMGVTGIPGDEKGARKMLEWCKAMGLEGVSVEPDPKQFPLIDKLTKEYGTKVAVHDHPKPSRYWDPQFLLDTIKD